MGSSGVRSGAVTVVRGGREGRRASTTAGFAAALPGLLAVVTFLVWAQRDGGYFPSAWYPGGIFLVLLAAVTIVATGARAEGRAPKLALASLAALAAWSYATIAWAEAPGDAWEAANRTALYLAVFALFALGRLASDAAVALLAAFSLGVAAVGTYAFLAAAGSGDPSSSFVSGRFAAPLGYQNAAAALFLLAFWPAFFAATRREVPTVARAGLLGVAGVLLELALLPQSRGALVAFVAAGAAYVALVPGRLRTLVHAVPVAAAVAVAAPSLLEVYRAAEEERLGPALPDARTALVGSFAALVVAGLGLALADRFLAVPARVTTVAGRTLAAAAAVAAVAALVAAAVLADPVDRVADAWSEFAEVQRGPPAGESEGATRLDAGTASNRHDMWRVAVRAFADRPVGGVGAGNFGVRYLEERRSDEDARYAHSIEFRLLAETGAVGLALALVFAASVLTAVWSRARRLDGLGRGAAILALVTFVSWSVHASVDWLWEFPAVTGPAFAWLGLALGVRPREDARGSRPSRWGSLVAVVLAAAVVASFAFPWLSTRELARAENLWRVDPSAAYAALDRAARLDPLDDDPALLEAAIASRRGEWQRVRDAALRALERNDAGWYARLQLAVAEGRLGRREPALAALEAARRRNPREPVLGLVEERLRSGARIDADELRRLLLERYRARSR